MKKQVFLSVILLLGFMVTFADAPQITMLTPVEGAPLVKNQIEQIKWTHSAFFNTHPQTCQIFCGSYVISPPVPVTADSFTWTVSKKADGSYLPQGVYKFKIVSPDYTVLNGPTIAVVNEDAKITITAPADGTTLTWGNKCMIRWTHTDYFHVIPQNCVILITNDADSTTNLISPPVPVLNNEFEWTVGKKSDGTSLPVGHYQISLEAPDYDALHGPHIIINIMIPHLPIWKVVQKLPIYKDPGCPMCFHLNPGDLKFDPVDQGPVIIEIVRGRQVLARLGRFGRGLALPGPVQITLDQESHGLLMRRQQGFELRILSAQGAILHTQAIQLELAR